MSEKPKISAIMSVYNGEEYLPEAIESVINQTFKSWELIIINDCSTDGTSEILKKYAGADERIKVYTNEHNLKLPSSLNRALSLCSGEYVARMDADDICLSDRFEKQYAFMEENSDVALSSCKFFTLKNGVVSSGGCGGKGDNESLKALLLVTNPLLHPGIIARADVMKSFMYDTSLTCTEDLELWIRMARNGLKLEILPEYLMIYRLHDKQITETTRSRQQIEVLKIQKEYYADMLECMSKEIAEFYISGIYFKDKIDIKEFCRYHSFLKAALKNSKSLKKSAVDYAAFEILAEYKRCGITKLQLLRALSHFNPLFLICEITDRKKRARIDGEKCIAAAEKLGLVHSGGSISFPIFSAVSK